MSSLGVNFFSNFNKIAILKKKNNNNNKMAKLQFFGSYKFVTVLVLVGSC